MNANRGIFALIKSHKLNPLNIRVSSFHSTPILERRRPSYFDSRFNYENKRFRKFNAKQTLLRNVSSFADELFQSWHHDFNDDYGSSSSQGWGWFEEDCSYNSSDSSRSRNKGWFDEEFSYKASKSTKSRNKGSHKWSELRFVDDLGLEVETFFRTGFGGKHSYSWSFVNEDVPHRHSSRHSNTYGNSKQRFRHKYEYYDDDDDDDDGSRKHEMRETDLSSQRLALGLNASGPLNLEDVKNAYRSCALKWHPDRHQGPSKVVAEEKFKACSSAYQSLCDNISLN